MISLAQPNSQPVILLSKQINFFLLFCSRTARLWALLVGLVPGSWLCPLLHSTQPHHPLGFLAGHSRAPKHRGTHGTGHPVAALLNPRSRSQRKPSSQGGGQGLVWVAGLTLCPGRTGTGMGQLQPLARLCQTSHRMVCVQRLPQFASGLPHIFVMLAKCCYHKLQKPTSSSSDQSETSTALHDVSSMSGPLRAPAGYSYCSGMLSFAAFGLFFHCRLHGP